MTQEKKKKIKFELYEDTAKNLIRFFKMNFKKTISLYLRGV